MRAGGSDHVVVIRRQQGTQRRAVGLGGKARGIGVRQIDVQMPAVLVTALFAHRVQRVQAGVQTTGFGRQMQGAFDPAHAETARQCL